MKKPVDILINFTLSKTHLMYVGAFIHYLESKDIQINNVYVKLKDASFFSFSGIKKVDVDSFLGKGWLQVEDIDRVSVFDFLFRRAKKRYQSELYYLHIGYIHYPNTVFSKFVSDYSKVHNVILPEGIGSSARQNWLVRLTCLKRESQSSNWLIQFAKERINDFFCKLFLSYSKIDLYDKNHKINEIFKKYILFKNENYLKNNCNTKKILFLSQPFVELGVISEEDYLNLIYQMINKFNTIGYIVKIRPHPAENLDRYNQFENIDIDFSLPIELLIDSPHVIMGFSSTSQPNLAAIYGMKMFCILDNHISKIPMSKTQKDIFKKYGGEPQTIDQIIHVLNDNSNE